MVHLQQHQGHDHNARLRGDGRDHGVLPPGGPKRHDHRRLALACDRNGAGLARWLPFSASEALGQVNMTGTARLLPQWGGAVVLAGYAIAFAAAAMVTTLRRDVT